MKCPVCGFGFFKTWETYINGKQQFVQICEFCDHVHDYNGTPNKMVVEDRKT